MENGTGKYENVLGNLICEDEEGNLVKVGSGFSDNQREEYWNERNELIGNIVEIQYQEVTKNKNGTKSLRFPVFVRFRDDKDQPGQLPTAYRSGGL
jgi:DNA ligase-1